MKRKPARSRRPLSRVGNWGNASARAPCNYRFLAERQNDGHQAAPTLYSEGSEPAPSEVYALLRRIDLYHVPETLEMGRWTTVPSW